MEITSVLVVLYRRSLVAIYISIDIWILLITSSLFLLIAGPCHVPPLSSPLVINVWTEFWTLGWFSVWCCSFIHYNMRTLNTCWIGFWSPVKQRDWFLGDGTGWLLARRFWVWVQTLGCFYMEFAFSSCACVGFPQVLRLPPRTQKHDC